MYSHRQAGARRGLLEHIAESEKAIRRRSVPIFSADICQTCYKCLVKENMYLFSPILAVFITFITYFLPPVPSHPPIFFPPKQSDHSHGSICESLYNDRSPRVTSSNTASQPTQLMSLSHSETDSPPVILSVEAAIHANKKQKLVT